MNILYIGSLNQTSNCYRRFKTLSSMGYNVQGININNSIYKGPFIKFHHHLNIGPGIQTLNKLILSIIKNIKFNIIWIDNKSFLNEKTFQEIKALFPKIKVILLVTDDITGKLKYQWRLTLKNLKYFDIIFVQRKINIIELKAYGANRIETCYRSYDPEFNRPFKLTHADILNYKCEVGFVGTYENEREEFIAYLIKNGIPVNVTGDGWLNGKYWNIIEPSYRGPSVYGENYIKTINGMDIALHFLRHGNRDEQDSRTFEIPACGIFMMAEKSVLHTKLFEPDKEAVFFESKEELLKLVRYYLNNKKERLTIAEAGLKACQINNYSHEGRLKEVIKKIFEN